jgi:hypothetical protein
MLLAELGAGDEIARRGFSSLPGGRFRFENRSGCLRDYDEIGQPTGFACVMRDITEQERMDRLLRLSEATAGSSK